MEIRFIAQPDVQLGRIVGQLFESSPPPEKIIFVSAFVGLQTILRFRESIEKLKRRGTLIRVVIGIDLGGTSQEVLKEIYSWNAECFVVKHRTPGHTFHPKVFLFEFPDKAEIIMGSNNLTEGGFFKNYEGFVRVVYARPSDEEAYQTAQKELRRFFTPNGPTVYALDKRLLGALIENADIPSEAEARKIRGDAILKMSKLRRKIKKAPSLFGVERINTPPPLPSPLLKTLLTNIRDRRKLSRRIRRKDLEKLGTIAPTSFYMTLPKLQGPNIPGEARIPLEAVELAKEFWGWRDEYTRKVGPRGGDGRVYWNWRPTWRIWSVQSTDKISEQPVRMYMYENSSDFRFYVRPLVTAGGDHGDIVRITRLAQADVEYECILARKGTPEYHQWLEFCTQSVRNSDRLFGYA